MKRTLYIPAIVLAMLALSVAGQQRSFAIQNSAAQTSQAQSAAGKPPGTVKKSPLAPYAGTWTSTAQGKPFATLKLVQSGDQISGSIQHPQRIDTDDSGGIKNFSDDSSTGIVQKAQLTGDGLLLTAKDSGTNETNQYAMSLTGENTANVKMVGMRMPPGMAKPKPWKFTKSGGAGSQ